MKRARFHWIALTPRLSRRSSIIVHITLTTTTTTKKILRLGMLNFSMLILTAFMIC
ncbi:uncharacterized protein DS421_16g538270 [Arachis hypogaea]|nr:uncharacterized protein DS421_16g538270 [Arachis hypogaea]